MTLLRRLTRPRVVVAGLLAGLAALLVWPAGSAGLAAQPGGNPPTEPTVTVPVAYTDVDPGAYYYEAVNRLAAAGVFEGTDCGPNQLCPDRPLLRREMAVWLIRALGEDDDLTDDESRFTDVEDSWYVPHIERMADLEITAGCRSDPPRFCPDQSVNRGQMASFLTRALDLPPAPSAGFTDVDYETNVHAKNIDSLAASEITAGCRTEPLRYCPSRSTSRAHMATFIYRALEWREKTAAGRIVEDKNPGVFLTEENDLSRFVKHEIVDKYADEHPWLMETWNHTNRPDFTYEIAEAGNRVMYDWSPRVAGESLRGIKASNLSVGPEVLEDAYYMSILIHELAHVYTMSTDGVSANPGPVAIAHLYFAHLVDTSCPPIPLGSELIADAARALLRYTNIQE